MSSNDHPRILDERELSSLSRPDAEAFLAAVVAGVDEATIELRERYAADTGYDLDNSLGSLDLLGQWMADLHPTRESKHPSVEWSPIWGIWVHQKYCSGVLRLAEGVTGYLLDCIRAAGISVDWTLFLDPLAKKHGGYYQYPHVSFGGVYEVYFPSWSFLVTLIVVDLHPRGLRNPRELQELATEVLESTRQKQALVGVPEPPLVPVDVEWYYQEGDDEDEDGDVRMVAIGIDDTIAVVHSDLVDEFVVALREGMMPDAVREDRELVIGSIPVVKFDQLQTFADQWWDRPLPLE